MSAAKRKFGALADEFLKLYPAANGDEAALQKPGVDKPVYTYYWTHRPTGDPAGAHHSSEIPLPRLDFGKRFF